VDFDVTAIERNLPRTILLAGDRRQQLLPNTAFAPSGKSVVNGLMRPIFGRAILPTTAASLHVHDTAQNAPIILAFRTGLVPRQMRFDLRPL
jgi:hypothetical protein